MKMRVLTEPVIRKFLLELVIILTEKGYFSYEEQAKAYVKELLKEIKTNLPKIRHKPAPKYYERYGKNLYYATIRTNKHTHWYPFFSKYEKDGETIYVVSYIGNNHTEAHHLYEEF
jgi:hypothetical protein